jgi:AraC-like DNA-binding protein
MKRKARVFLRYRPRRLPRNYASVVARIPFYFDALRLSVTHVDDPYWHALHVVPNVTQFELEHGVEQFRFAYNHRCMLQAARSGAPVLGHHGGFSDLFVPIVKPAGTDQMLITGPFRTEPIASSEIQERWRTLTAGQGHLSDPEFANYVAISTATPVFKGGLLDALKRLMICMASLMAERGDPDALAAELEAVETKLGEATFEHRMWEAARMMVDPATARIWASAYNFPRREALGLRHMPEHALVGLIAGSKNELDPVDEILRRYQFQRACLALARSHGDLATGPVGSHGVAFLLPAERSEGRSRATMLEIAERASNLGRRQFQLRLHFGVSSLGRGASLPVRYQRALAAAERALSQDRALVHAVDHVEHSENVIRDSRAELSRLAREPSSKLTARFDRYIDTVMNHCGHQVELVRAELGAGLERLADPFLKSGALDPKSWNDVMGSLDRANEVAVTWRDVAEAYRRAVPDIEHALREPTSAHRERNLRRATDFIREHATESLSLRAVARLAGYEPHYFSRLFKQRENMTFEAYVTRARIERAQQMLHRTTLSIERVAKLSGFSSSQYFHRVFKHAVGETPLEYKRRPI